MLIPRSGSLTPQSPDPIDPVITKTTDVLDQAPFVALPAAERNALDTDTYQKVSRALAAYTSGSSVTVTYFHDLADGGKTIRSHVADMASERNIIHGSYLRINNLEMKLQEPWNYQMNPETGQFDIVGVGVMYQQMVPSIGDVFFAFVGDGVVGKFSITSSRPMSWRRDKVFQVGFSLNQIDDENKTLFNIYVAMTEEERIFEKTTFLANPGALLTQVAYKQLQTLRTWRPRMISYYYNTFYNATYDTLINVEGNYDPYVVHFMHQKVSFSEESRVSKQIYPNVINTFYNTIWSRMLDRNDLTLIGISQYVRDGLYNQNTNDVSFTPLTGCGFILSVRDYNPDDPGLKSGYVFSPEFYAGDLTPDTGMSDFEEIVYASIKERRVLDVAELISDYITQFQTLSKAEQFYRIPVYLHLMDTAIMNLTLN